MSIELHSEEELEAWERASDHKIVWVCPNSCGYRYEAARHFNEALNCPSCHVPTEEGGETYSC